MTLAVLASVPLAWRQPLASWAGHQGARVPRPSRGSWAPGAVGSDCPGAPVHPAGPPGLLGGAPLNPVGCTFETAPLTP